MLKQPLAAGNAQREVCRSGGTAPPKDAPLGVQAEALATSGALYLGPGVRGVTQSTN